MRVKFFLLLLKARLADLWFFPVCFVWAHSYADQNFCSRCGSIFVAGSWSGFELKERIRKIVKKREKPPF
jgi:hypothetical protein